MERPSTGRLLKGAKVLLIDALTSARARTEAVFRRARGQRFGVYTDPSPQRVIMGIQDRRAIWSACCG